MDARLRFDFHLSDIAPNDPLHIRFWARTVSATRPPKVNGSPNSQSISVEKGTKEISIAVTPLMDQLSQEQNRDENDQLVCVGVDLFSAQVCKTKHDLAYTKLIGRARIPALRKGNSLKLDTGSHNILNFDLETEVGVSEDTVLGSIQCLDGITDLEFPAFHEQCPALMEDVINEHTSWDHQLFKRLPDWGAVDPPTVGGELGRIPTAIMYAQYWDPTTEADVISEEVLKAMVPVKSPNDISLHYLVQWIVIFCTARFWYRPDQIDIYENGKNRTITGDQFETTIWYTGAGDCEDFSFFVCRLVMFLKQNTHTTPYFTKARELLAAYTPASILTKACGTHSKVTCKMLECMTSEEVEDTFGINFHMSAVLVKTSVLTDKLAPQHRPTASVDDKHLPNLFLLETTTPVFPYPFPIKVKPYDSPIEYATQQHIKQWIDHDHSCAMAQPNTAPQVLTNENAETASCLLGPCMEIRFNLVNGENTPVEYFITTTENEPVRGIKAIAEGKFVLQSMYEDKHAKEVVDLARCMRQLSPPTWTINSLGYDLDWSDCAQPSEPPGHPVHIWYTLNNISDPTNKFKTVTVSPYCITPATRASESAV